MFFGNTNWKIVKDVFMYEKQLKTKDVHNWEINPDEPIYNCYRRTWKLFWVLKKQLTQYGYDNLVKRVNNDGNDFDSLYKRVNF